MSAFIDNFSSQAHLYAQHRPRYPQALYDFLLSQVKSRICAWDCATGNGQVATVLNHYFEHVYATDASAAQLAQADHRRNDQEKTPQYSTCTAESTPFPDHFFDLITVAQALHWFQFNAFYQEVRRVSKPAACLATWGYSLMHTGHESIDALIHDFYTQQVGSYWDAERKHIDAGYRTIPFPFQEIATPDFWMEIYWTLDDCAGYLATWSSVQKYIRANGHNPVDSLRMELQPFWTTTLRVQFPLFMKMGVVE